MTGHNKELTEEIYVGYNIQAAGNEKSQQPLSGQTTTSTLQIEITRFPRRTSVVNEGIYYDADGKIKERWKTVATKGGTLP